MSMRQLEIPRTSVNDVQVIEAGGPWPTKSGGNLMVHFALPYEATQAFLNYGNPEFDALKEESGVDIRGLRSYTVSDIPKGRIGGLEWHIARTEYVTALGGRALWQCVDRDGRERDIVLEEGTAIIQPPGIVHTYKALKKNTRLQVVCNTLFDPKDPRTHDTYSRELFDQLRTEAA